MQCDKCRKNAVICQRYSGLHLCNRHFTLDFETKAKRAIRTHTWLERGDRIAVVLSGSGADCALLHFLTKLTGRRRDITLSAIIPDYAADYTPDLSSSSGTFAASLGVTCIPASFPEEFGSSPDEMVREREALQTTLGLMKRSLVYRVARRHNMTKLAFSSSLDEEAEHVLEQVLSGTPDRLLRLTEQVSGPVPIRPFMYASSEEIILYTRLTTRFTYGDLPSVPGDPFTADIRLFLQDYTRRHPSAPYSLVSLSEQLAGSGMPAQENTRSCNRCGIPYRDTCPVCRITEEGRCHAR